MAEGSGAERLAATRQFVVVLRLVVEAGGNILYGEVVDSRGESGHRFVGLIGLGDAVRIWLRQAMHGNGLDDEESFEPDGTEHGPVG